MNTEDQLNQKSFVRVIDQTEQELFRCSIEEREKAFEFAKQMENLGIEVTLQEPSSIETLAINLGIDAKEQEKLKATIDHEIKEHN